MPDVTAEKKELTDEHPLTRAADEDDGLPGRQLTGRLTSIAVPQPIEYSPFCSRSVTQHLLRGGAGLLLVIWAFFNATMHPVLALGAAAFALVAWRGCPMCWTIGLVETIVRRVHPPRA